MMAIIDVLANSRIRYSNVRLLPVSIFLTLWLSLWITFTFIKLAIVPSQEKTYPRHCTYDKTY